MVFGRPVYPLEPDIEIFHMECYSEAVRRRDVCGVCSKEDNVLSLNHDAAGAAETGGAVTAPPTDVTSEDLLARILSSLEDDKAEDIVQIDLRGRSSIGDYMVVCSGRSSRQVAAIAEKLVDRLKQEMGRASRIEGKETGDWVLIDTGDVIVHIFRPEVREFYQIEKMWQPAGAAPARA